MNSNYFWWFYRNDLARNEVEAFYEQLFESTALNELIVWEILVWIWNSIKTRFGFFESKWKSKVVDRPNLHMIMI